MEEKNIINLISFWKEQNKRVNDLKIFTDEFFDLVTWNLTDIILDFMEIPKDNTEHFNLNPQTGEFTPIWWYKGEPYCRDWFMDCLYDDISPTEIYHNIIALQKDFSS